MEEMKKGDNDWIRGAHICTATRLATEVEELIRPAPIAPY